MQSKATSVAQYLAELPADRRAAIEAVRKVILKNLDKGYEEGMQYGMIGYFVPHSIYPAGYHCDPKQPLCYAGLASQKNHMSLYLMCVYDNESQITWFRNAWEKTGKKLDMGKSCVRFKKVEDLALDVIGEAIRRTPVKKFLDFYETALLRLNSRSSKGPPAKAAKKTAQPAKPVKAIKKPAKSVRPAQKRARSGK